MGSDDTFTPAPQRPQPLPDDRAVFWVRSWSPMGKASVTGSSPHTAQGHTCVSSSCFLFANPAAWQLLPVPPPLGLPLTSTCPLPGGGAT